MKNCFIILFFILAGTGSIYAQANTIGSGIELQIVSNVSSYVDLGDVYNTLNFPLTFECWINPSSFTSVVTFDSCDHAPDSWDCVALNLGSSWGRKWSAVR